MEEETGKVITKVNLNEQPSVTFKVSESDYGDNRGDKMLLPVMSVCRFHGVNVIQLFRRLECVKELSIIIPP